MIWKGISGLWPRKASTQLAETYCLHQSIRSIHVFHRHVSLIVYFVLTASKCFEINYLHYRATDQLHFALSIERSAMTRNKRTEGRGVQMERLREMAERDEDLGDYEVGKYDHNVDRGPVRQAKKWILSRSGSGSKIDDSR